MATSHDHYSGLRIIYVDPNIRFYKRGRKVVEYRRGQKKSLPKCPHLQIHTESNCRNYYYYRLSVSLEAYLDRKRGDQLELYDVGNIFDVQLPADSFHAQIAVVSYRLFKGEGPCRFLLRQNGLARRSTIILKMPGACCWQRCQKSIRRRECSVRAQLTYIQRTTQQSGRHISTRKRLREGLHSERGL